jgi:hypothetical protein
VDLIRLADLPWLILQPSVASTMISYEFLHEPLALLLQRCYHEIFLAICAKEKSVGNFLHIHLIEIVMQTFRWKSLRGWDSRPQLIVVSGLFGGNPFVGGILGHNLLLSRAFFGGNPFLDGIFRPQLVVVSSLFFHDGILTITKPFSRTFFFFRDGILAITKPFSRTFFFFHDGILAITKPFSRTFFFFHDGILAITKPFSRTFFFFHDGILAITEPLSRTFSFFHNGILAITQPFS